MVFGQRIPAEEELSTHYSGYKRNNSISPITVKRYEELLDEFEPFRKSNRILDIGCGDGHFLAVAKARGWEVFGTEFTDEAVSAGKNKGITIYKGRIQDYAGPSEFDIITSFEVLEHINDCNEHAQHIFELLRKGGQFYFTTPNFNSLSRRLLGANWKMIEYPEHLSYYTVKSIDSILKRAGLLKGKFKTTGFAMQKFHSTDEQMDGKAGRNEELRATIEKKPLLQFVKLSINAALSAFRLGDTLKGYYQKP